MNSDLQTNMPVHAPQPVPLARSLSIWGAIFVAIAVVGFMLGIARPVTPYRASSRAVHPPLDQAEMVPNYAEIDAKSVGRNRAWVSNFETLRQQVPGLFDAVTRTAALKEEALQDRLRTRAFDGAPPVIPHAIEQQSAANCLVCHAQGLVLGNRIATRISHPHYTSCTQCHVEAVAGLPSSAHHVAHLSIHSEPPTNTFAGMLRAGPGVRAMPHAPPTIPHTLQLRTDCLSCHGLIARPGLRTTHPWLQNCVQCHVTTSDRDTVPFNTAPDTFPTTSIGRNKHQVRLLSRNPPEDLR